MKSVIEFDALGTHWSIELIGSLADAAVVAALTEKVETFEHNYSRFDPSSLIGQLNATKQLNNPPEELIAMLRFAKEMYAASDGVFNISVGGSLTGLGYGKGGGNAKADQAMWDNVSITKRKITIPADCELDFGGFGKGWLIDELGVLLKQHGRNQFVINGGGDILVNTIKPVELALEHPRDETRKIGTTRIQQGALASSSSVKRSWKKNGKTQHHIIDPRSGKPSKSKVVSTFVRANSALVADVMATILMIAPELNEKLRKTYQLKTILLQPS